jgi:histidyl-tRNA synthetase
MAENPKLSTENYKGVRDFYPPDMALQKHLWSAMREVAERFGYAEYSASLLEPAELYEVKSGEEIVNEQMYVFTDRGDRRVALRPEMTPTVARMVAAKKRDLSFPLRWYSIANMFRYERPQRGRLREHWQLNADLFGAPGPDAEVEIISLAYRIMQRFGAREEDFTIYINDRESLRETLTGILKSADLLPQALRLLDKKEKITKEEFDREWEKLSERPWEASEEPSERISGLIDALATLGIRNVRYNPELVRGFDYYTGTVFEVFDTDPKNARSLFGGGRYDRLLEMFGQESVPAVGFGMGDVTMRDFLETHSLLPEYRSPTHLFICTVEPTFSLAAQELAQRLRDAGISVAVNLSDRKIGDQIKTADKQRIPFVLCLGENELRDRRYAVKNLSTGEETQLDEGSLPAFVSGHTNN